MLSIVIVNTDGTEDTMNCLESIFRNPPVDTFEVILVDNYSTEPVLPDIHKKYPQVRTFSAPQRQGFAKNYNLGMRQAVGEYVMILNNDTIVHAEALNALVTAIRENKSYGMVGPKLISPNGQIQTFCARDPVTLVSYVLKQFLLDLSMPLGKLWDKYLQWKLSRRSSGPVSYLAGACMMTSRVVMDRVGLMDEGYDFYFVEDDWCHRVGQHGLQVAYIAEAPITHIGDQTMSKLREWGKKTEYYGAIRYFRRCFDVSAWQLWIIWLATAVGFFLRACAFGVIGVVTGRKEYAHIYWRLLRWIMAKTPTKTVAEQLN